MKKYLKQVLVNVLALGILITLYSLSRLPELSGAERTYLKGQFLFERTMLYAPEHVPARSVRDVHPQYRHISSWISSVGAAVAVTDFDNNGLSNDIVHVDPRFNKVLVSAAPGTSCTYTPFEIYPHSVAYDPLTMAPMGTLCYDFNNDGLMDILVYYWGRSPILFYYHPAGFQEEELVTPFQRWFSNSGLLSDLDGYGNIDILICNYFPDGADVLNSAAKDWSQQMQHSMSRAYNGGLDHIFLCDARLNSISFKEDTAWRNALDHSTDWTLAVGARDFNGDMLPELYFANDFGPDLFLLNLSRPGQLKFRELRGNRRLSDIRSGVVGRDSFKGMGIDFADINDDGLTDIFVSNIAHEFALEESHLAFINSGQVEEMSKGVAPFTNKSEALGLSRSEWSWDAKFGDFNNDGIPELLQATGFVHGNTSRWPELQELAMGNDELLSNAQVWPRFEPGADLSGAAHNYFFSQAGGRFFDISDLIGVGQQQVSRGISLSDVDHDGKLDYIVANQWEPSFFYRNEYRGNNRFMGLRLMLKDHRDQQRVIIDSIVPGPLRFAIGAEALLKCKGKVVSAVVDGGNGHSGKNANELFVGLGLCNPHEKIDVEIRWRSSNGAVQQFKTQLTPAWHTIILPW